jgi:primosomal protein N' (replication factor Y)
VLDAHAEAYVEERAPTWDATVLAVERARRADVPCLLVSPVPSLEQLARLPLFTLPAAEERSGWPRLQVLDRRRDDPHRGLYAEPLAALAHAARRAEPDRPVLFVLNRTGRIRLLACAPCGELTRCEHCGGAMAELARAEPGSARTLTCPNCHATRPAVCAACGSTRLRQLRVGVGRAAEELAALLGSDVVEVTAGEERPTGAFLVGTEAVLHRVAVASLVVFLDFDQELLAPRYRAAEQALVLLARAARLLFGRRPPPPSRRLVVQTRLPDHAVLAAAAAGDPGLLVTEERQRRRALGLPPDSALAELSGPDAGVLAAAVNELARRERLDVEVAELGRGHQLVRAADHELLASVIAAVREEEHTVRVAVDPIGV